MQPSCTRVLRIILFFIFPLLVVPFFGKAQLNISSGQTAAALAQKLTGQGVTVLNPVLTCDYYASGIFTNTNKTFGLDSGILLTTGIAADASGYEPTLASTRLNTPGDPQLNSLAHATTYDACRLEFDVIPKDDSLRFEYVFGSEEYNNATCGPYNDAFSFFISGPGISGRKNIALIPGTAIPVAVNSINNGVPGPQGNISNCTSMGAGSPFTSYYVDNTNGSTFSYKGFTKVLRVTQAVQPCATYHLQLTIADAGNGLYDSGVFLKAGSLRTSTYDISSVSSTGVTPPVIAPGCNNARIIIKRSEKKPTAQTVHYLIDGTAVPGMHYASIADSAVIPAGDSAVRFTLSPISGTINGPKTAKLYLMDPYSCNSKGKIIDSTIVTIFDAPAVSVLVPDTTICAGDAIALNTHGTRGLDYNWSPANMVGSTTAAPVVRPGVTTTYTVTATLPGSGCAPATDSIRVTVMKGPKVFAGLDTQICTGGTAKLVALAQPFAGGYLYSWIAPNGYVVNDSAMTLSNATRADSGQYVVQVLGSSNACYGRDTVNVLVRPLPAAPAVISPLALCVNEPIGPLGAGGNSLLWYPDSVGGTASVLAPTPVVTEPAIFNYFVAQLTDGCESRRAAINVSVLNCCGSDLALPTAITPNGDGRNDYFSILHGAEGAGVDIHIYNRWGQTVFHGTGSDRWDGTQNGQPVPVGTYYFVISLDCRNGNMKQHKGEVTVLR